MIERLTILLKQHGLSLAVLWAVVILGLSTMATVNLPETWWDIFGPDKWAHAFIYGVFTILLIAAFFYKSTLNLQKSILWSIVIATLYGTLMEVVQYTFFPNRYFELLDILANIIGILGSLLSLKYIFK